VGPGCRAAGVPRRLTTTARPRYPGRLDHFGDAYSAVGDRAARDAWQQALNILDQLGVVRAGVGPGFPDADEINAKLHRLETPGSSGPAP
jgi:hypothetical protein